MDMMDSKPAETLRIKNFRGLKDVTIEVGDFTVLIGPQASGKSVIAKLLYYFRGAIERFKYLVVVAKDIDTVKRREVTEFLKYFPLNRQPAGEFECSYSCGDYQIRLTSSDHASQVAIDYSPFLAGLIGELLAIVGERGEKRSSGGGNSLGSVLLSLDIKQVISRTLHSDALYAVAGETRFVPAARGFFATLQNSIFGLLSENANIDPIVSEFGRLYEFVRGQWGEFNGSMAEPSQALRSRMELVSVGKYVFEEETNRE